MAEVFEGLKHKTTYFKRQGRQEQEGKKMTPKTKGSKESKNSCNNFVTTVKISFLFVFFFHGGGAIGIHVTCGACFMRTIDAINMESYAPGLLHLQQPLKMP